MVFKETRYSRDCYIWLRVFSKCTYVEQIIDLCTTLHYLGVPVNDVIHMFGDNESVVNSSRNFYSKLTKYHNALSYHYNNETIESKYIHFKYIPR